VLDDGEAATGLVPPDLEVHSQCPQTHRLAFTWADDQQPALQNLHISTVSIFAIHRCILTIVPDLRSVNNQVTLEIPEIARKYVLKRRAESQDATRERIVDAAVALHHTVGPAHTSDAAIAEKAGVTRRTFYRHFPDELSLFRACTSHSFENWPPPEPDKWRRVADPEARLRLALNELYAYYRDAGAGLMVIMRDRTLMRPELLSLPGRASVLRAMPGVLLEAWNVRGRRRQVLTAALIHVTAVTTWHSLVMEQHVTGSEAIELLVALVMAAAGPEVRLRQ